MAEPRSALMGRTAPGPLAVRDAGLVGMVAIRGDLAAETFQRAVGEVAGVHIPARRRAEIAERTLLWMSPDELLLICAHDEAGGLAQALTESFGDAHAMALDVSDARAVIELEGRGLRDTLAKLAPVDLHPERFGTGDIRRTRLGQVAAAFWLTGEETARVICFRSVAQYVFALLVQSAKDGPAGLYSGPTGGS